MSAPSMEASEGGPVIAVRPARAPGRVRAEVAAFPLLVVAAYLFRVQSFTAGLGSDEFSLLAMAEAVRAGEFPYERYWDVRAPLAYLWGLPSAYAQDAHRAVGMLRQLSAIAHACAAWTFFCLFRPTLGTPATVAGTLVLLASANMTALHVLAVPNHFTMAMSVAAFACAVEGLRRGSWPVYLASALLAGLLPWVMVHAMPVALSLAALAVVAAPGPRRLRWWRLWLAVAALPSVGVMGAYFLWGPFDVLVRTVFLAPLEVMEWTEGAGYRFFSGEEIRRLLGAAPWVVLYAGALAAGAAWLPRAIREAPRGSGLRLSAFLALPLAAGFAVMAYAKPPAPPEYWIDAAPVAALLAAVAVSRVLAWPGWAAPAVARHVRPRILRTSLVLCLGAALLLPIDPWERASKPPLPGEEYCASAAHRIGRLGPSETVLDLNGLCGFKVHASGATLHPPFTFVHLWFRQLGLRWIGEALAGDGSEDAAAVRLAEALAPGSSVGVILADRRLLHEVRERGWEESFYREWRLVWFRRIEGYDPEDRLSRLGILVRRDASPRPGVPWS